MWKEEKTGGPGCGKRTTQEPLAVDGFPETRGRFAGLLEMGRFLPERAARVSGGRGMRRARRVEALIRRASPFSSALLVPLTARLRAKLACERGQGTTEYAILVGVLVVIAILAITVFRPKLEELWQAIASGIQGL